MIVVTSSAFATSASSECGVGSAECGISVVAAGARLRPRLSFDDSSFVRTTRPDAEGMESLSACAGTLRRDKSVSAGMLRSDVEDWWLLVVGWRSVFESRVDDLIILPTV